MFLAQMEDLRGKLHDLKSDNEQLRDDIKDLQDKEHKRSLSSSASSYGSIEGLNKTTVCCKRTDVVL